MSSSLPSLLDPQDTIVADTVNQVLLKLEGSPLANITTNTAASTDSEEEEGDVESYWDSEELYILLTSQQREEAVRRHFTSGIRNDPNYTTKFTYKNYQPTVAKTVQHDQREHKFEVVYEDHTVTILSCLRLTRFGFYPQLDAISVEEDIAAEEDTNEGLANQREGERDCYPVCTVTDFEVRDNYGDVIRRYTEEIYY